MRLKKKRQGKKLKSKPIKRRKRKLDEPVTPVAKPVKLGAMAFATPMEQIWFAKDLANDLKKIIHEHNWFQLYEDQEYVRVEGWSMLGSMIGVTPVEEFVREIRVSDEDHTVKGYEAKINLLCNGLIVGGASSECTIDEALWAGRDTFALRSMTLTRATSKAFRLNYGWIISLAGFAEMPAAELVNPDKKIVLEKPVEKKATATNGAKAAATVFVVWPESHNGNMAFIFGDGLHSVEGKAAGLDAYLQQEFHAVFSDKFSSKGGYLIPAYHMDATKVWLERGGFIVNLPKNPWGKAAGA